MKVIIAMEANDIDEIVKELHPGMCYQFGESEFKLVDAARDESKAAAQEDIKHAVCATLEGKGAEVELVRAVEDVLNADMRAVAKRLTQQAIWRVRCLNCGHPVAHHLDAAGEPT